MSEEKQVIVMPDNQAVPIDERLMKAFEKIAEQTFLKIEKRDYRATVVQRNETSEIPDSAAALIHINEDTRDENDNPLELDVKGHITPYEAYMFKDVNYAQALVRLKNWAYFEEPEIDRAGNPVYDKNGNLKLNQIPVNLAQIDMLSKKRLNLGVNGIQSYKHISERRANAGIPDEESLGSKLTGWAGFKKERVSKEELEAQYGKGVNNK